MKDNRFLANFCISGCPLRKRSRLAMKVEGGPSRARWILKPLRWGRLMCLPISALRKIGMTLTLISTSFLQDADSSRAFYRRNVGRRQLCMNYLFSRTVARHTRNLIELTILQCIGKILFCMRKQLLTFSLKRII